MPLVDQELPVDPEPDAVVGNCVESVRARERRLQLAEPPDRERVRPDPRGGRIPAPVEVHRRVRPHGHAVREVHVVEVLGAQAVPGVGRWVQPARENLMKLSSGEYQLRVR